MLSILKFRKNRRIAQNPLSDLAALGNPQSLRLQNQHN